MTTREAPPEGWVHWERREPEMGDLVFGVWDEAYRVSQRVGDFVELEILVGEHPGAYDVKHSGDVSTMTTAEMDDRTIEQQAAGFVIQPRRNVTRGLVRLIKGVATPELLAAAYEDKARRLRRDGFR